MPQRVSCRRLRVVVLALLCAPTHRALAQALDIVRGHVRSVARAPVRDATLRASGRDRTVKIAQTDSAGAFTIAFAAAVRRQLYQSDVTCDA